MINGLTPEHLADVFTRSAFLELLRRAGNRTYRTDNETSFGIGINGQNGDISLGCLNEGTDYGICREGVMYDSGLPIKDIPFALVHFHPNRDGPVFPSRDDLFMDREWTEDSLFSDEADAIVCTRFAMRPIEGIGKIRRDRSIELLLYQQMTDSITLGDKADANLLEYLNERGVEDSEEAISKSDITTLGVKNILITAGYNAYVLRYPASIKSAQGKSIFRERFYPIYRKELAQFGHDFKILSRRDLNLDFKEKDYLT